MEATIQYRGLELEVDCTITGNDRYYGCNHPNNEESECKIESVTFKGHDFKPLIDNLDDWYYIKELIYDKLDDIYG